MIQQLINGVNSISTYLANLISSISGIYHDVDFTDLFVSLFPNDMAIVCASVLSIILFLSLISLVKKLILFLGG